MSRASRAAADPDAPRKDLELQFFEDQYGEDNRTGFLKYYAVNEAGSARDYKRWLLERAPGRDVLEYGCGDRPWSIELHRRGSRVRGIDLSPTAVGEANERAREAGMTGEPYQAMDAEQLAFPDDSFDVVCGYSILHHLDLRRAWSEIVRVLRPDGAAIFVEPLGHNPAINYFRNRTPEHRTRDEHPFVMSDLELTREYFGEVDYAFHHLVSLAAVPFRESSRFPGIAKRLVAVDEALFRWVPALRPLAWQVVITLEQPVRR